MKAKKAACLMTSTRRTVFTVELETAAIISSLEDSHANLFCCNMSKFINN